MKEWLKPEINSSLRGWHGSHELSPGRARPRLISRIDLKRVRGNTAVPAKVGAAIFVLGWPVL